ncbi:hypothetical protein [Syntrophomonas curvata]
MRFNRRAGDFVMRNMPLVALMVFALVLVLSPVLPASGSVQEDSGIKVYCNGDFRGSTAYIDPASGVGMLPLALIESLPGLRLNVRDNQAWFALNGRQLRTTVGSNAYTIDGQNKTWRCGLQPWRYGIAAPGRDLFEALGASVRWDGNERAIYIDALPPTPNAPENLSQASLPLRLAFIQNEQLWLLDASAPGTQPLPVPGRNIEQIIGWSRDGKWLAYLQRTSDDPFSGEKNLWVVSSDGQRRQCLDNLPLAYHTPVWSPTENIIAYQVQPENQADIQNIALRVAYQENGQWRYRELAKSGERSLGSGLAWFPDGQSLAVSWVHDKNNLPELSRIDLQGRACSLLVLPAALAGNYQDGMYIRDITGLKLSPDGRYLACFLGMNSASINADGMNLQIVDLQQRTLFPVGGALGYPEWVAWSPDSRAVAVILGGGREASIHKHLAIVQIGEDGFKVRELGETGRVDSRPIWAPDGSALYFSRGPESLAWEEEGRHQEAPVPGQQIFSRRAEQAQSLSGPGEEQADYPLSLSPDGRYLVTQRLDYVDLGALHLMDLKNGQTLKFMDNLQAQPGYYGNYYPDGVSVYWME